MRFIVFTFLLNVILSSAADNFVIRGRVCDANDQEDIIGATVRVLSQDSSLVSATVAQQKIVKNGEEGYTSDFHVSLPRNGSAYILEITGIGYERECLNITPQQYAAAKGAVELPLIQLHPKSKILQGVTVSTSRIKFFNRGDTVVFNADAFQLPDGSMLDALVSQLPGVELKANGQIFYNGRYVESLLLDGKHFFKGDNQLVLENLGAYSVKDIKIYDRLGDASSFAGRELAGDKELVMDVKLKKEYSTGLIVNAEAGVGTHGRYLGRLFGMLFTPKSRVTIYGNSNNLNDERKPGKSASWTPADLKNGVKRTNTGGIDYLSEDKLKGWKVSGNAQGSHTDHSDHTDVYRTNFLASGNNFERDFARINNKGWKLSTNHTFYLKRKKFDLTVTPKLEYDNRKLYSDRAAATFSSDIQGLSFDKIADGEMGSGIFSDWLNRTTNLNRTINKTFDAALSAESRIKIRGSSDIFRAGTNGVYSNTHETRFNRYNLKFAETAGSDRFLDRYFSNRPNHTSRIGAHAGLNHVFSPDVSFDVTYRYTHSDRKATSMLYNLQEQYGEGNAPAFGTLPSMGEYLSTLDMDESFISHSIVNNHVISPFLVWGKGNWSGQVNVPVTFSANRLGYIRGDVDTTVVRSTTLVNIDNTFVTWRSPDKTKKIELFYSMSSESPDLVNLVDIVDATDPMNIYGGAKSLKNSHYHKISLHSEFLDRKHFMMHLLTLRYNNLHNGLTKGYVYNTATGVRHWQTFNISGNWDASAAYGFGWQFGKSRQITLQSLTTGSVVNSVDYIGEDNAAPSKQRVRSYGVNEILKLQYALGKNTIGATADVTYRHYGDMGRMNPVTQNYGVNAILNLSSHLQLSTDFNVITRSGFAEKALNTTDFVWNARLGYSLMKGNLLLMLDGYDILHNLSNVTYSVNAQARTETHINVLPRYFMFHIQYRFNRQPRKKK